jgi:chromosomal replication initiation ATPase DnaA
MPSSQIPLSFPVEESYDPHDFIPLSCNQDALAWIDRHPDWPYPAVIIYGEKGCGKTHLLKLWQDKTGSTAIDNVDTVFGDETREQDLFHQFNQARENGSFLLLSMTDKISSQSISLPDLKSRLMAAPQCEITQPDETDLAVILTKLAHDRQLKIDVDVMKYILPRIERSFTSANDLIAKIDSQALAQKRAVTIPLVKTVLEC